MTRNLRWLIVVAVALAAVALVDWFWRSSQSDVAGPVMQPASHPPRPVEVEMAGRAAPTETAAGQLNQYSPVFEWPLFSPTRTPQASPTAESPIAQPVVAAPDPLDSARLVGVAAGDQGRVALVQNNGQTVRLEVGDGYGDWIVSGIGHRNVIFMRGDEARELVIGG